MAKSEEAEIKRRLERATKLLDKARELHAQQFDVLEEARKILAGEVALGDKLRALSDYYVAAWETRYGSRYAWQGVKDSSQAKRLLKLFTLEDLEARILRWVKDGDPFYVKARHPFALFASNVNRYAPEGQGFALESAAVDCHHEPRCSSDAEHTKRQLTERRA